MKTQKQSYKQTSNGRQNLRGRLSIDWIRAKRPDVAIAIEAQIDMKFPRVHTKFKKTTLPPELARMRA